LSKNEHIAEVADREYEWGFVTDIESVVIPKGLDENVVRLISAKKKEPEFMLEYRLKAFRHWLTLEEPQWPKVHYPKIDYQDIIYFAAPVSDEDRPKSLDDLPEAIG
jgi:Fe-S cluster assembly protein SufB